jgi:RHS repeat-associated protein
VNHKGEAFSFAYDNNSRLTTINRPGSQTSFSFDNTNFLTSIIHNRSGGTIGYFTYTRDAIGNRTSAGREIGSHSYTYDADGQLLSATNPDVEVPYQNEVFEYDKLGNRTKFNGQSYSFDGKKQRLTEDWQFVYTYDANGNMLTKQDKGLSGRQWNYKYTSENQLIEVEYNNNGQIEMVAQYKYDALGRRIQKKVEYPLDVTKSFERNYAYDSYEIIAETDELDRVLGVYTHSAMRTDDVLSIDIKSDGVGVLAQSSGSYYYHKDASGSITHISNGVGQLVQTYQYSSYGVLSRIRNGIGVDISSNPVLLTSYSFTGREWEFETGMYYYRARYYDAISGRFTQADPHPGIWSNPITFTTKYSYTGNNPVNNTDPSGEFYEGFFQLETAKFLEKNGLASKSFVNATKSTVIAANIIGAASYAGSSIGKLAGDWFAKEVTSKFFLDAVFGTLAGGTAGGVVGGTIYEASGVGTFRQGFAIGFGAGASAALQNTYLSELVGNTCSLNGGSPAYASLIFRALLLTIPLLQQTTQDTTAPWYFNKNQQHNFDPNIYFKKREIQQYLDPIEKQTGSRCQIG